MGGWRNVDVICLIDTVKLHPSLWNTTMRMCGKRKQTPYLWEATARQINMTCKPAIEFSPDQCRRKWTYLRAYFRVENKRAIKAKQCIDSAEEVESSAGVWKYLSKMNFLIDGKCSSALVNTFNNSDEPTINVMSNVVEHTKKLAKKNEKGLDYSMFVRCCLDKLDGDLNLDAREGINSVLAKVQKEQLLRNKNKQ